MSRRLAVTRAVEAIAEAVAPGSVVAHINYGDGHRRMLLYNRRHDRALRRSRRNQPPRPK